MYEHALDDNSIFAVVAGDISLFPQSHLGWLQMSHCPYACKMLELAYRRAAFLQLRLGNSIY